MAWLQRARARGKAKPQGQAPSQAMATPVVRRHWGRAHSYRVLRPPRDEPPRMSGGSRDFENDEVGEAGPVHLNAVASGAHHIGPSRRGPVAAGCFVQRRARRNDQSADERLLSESDRPRTIEAAAAYENGPLVCCLLYTSDAA